MKRATILIPCLLTGGTEVATLDTAKALSKLGFSVTVLVYFDELDPAMLSAFQQAGIAVMLLRLARRGGGASLLPLAWALARSLWRERPALVWVQYMTPTLVPLVVARLFTRRLVAAVHVAARHYSSGGLRRLRWLASWWCDQLICVSHTTAKAVLGERLGSRLLRHVLVIPNALDMRAAEKAEPHDWHRQLGIDEDHRIVGYVGRLAHNKGADILLRASASVDHQYPDTHWVIVGEGPERAFLQQLATESGLEDKVHFAGSLPREAVLSALKGFDIAVAPSREEGFGLTALEAMACGVPLIASRVDALAEIVIDGKTGLLFSPADHGDLSRNLCSMIQDPWFCKRLGKEAAAHANKTYGLPNYQNRIASLLQLMGFEA